MHVQGMEITPRAFASKTPRQIIAHRDDSEFERDMTDAEWREAGLPWVDQHNEPNPILVELRGAIADGSTPAYVYGVYLRWVSTPDTWTDEHRDHARRVLSRLAV